MSKSLDFYKENIQSLSFSGVSTDEQETVIAFSRNDDTASVETTDSTVLTKLKRYAATNPDEWVLTNVTTGQNESDPMKITSICFECPKKLISLRSKSTSPRELTEEERAEIAERMRNVRAGREDEDYPRYRAGTATIDSGIYTVSKTP